MVDIKKLNPMARLGGNYAELGNLVKCGRSVNRTCAAAVPVQVDTAFVVNVVVKVFVIFAFLKRNN